jgi:hypothetical protein
MPRPWPDLTSHAIRRVVAGCSQVDRRPPYVVAQIRKWSTGIGECRRRRIKSSHDVERSKEPQWSDSSPRWSSLAFIGDTLLRSRDALTCAIRSPLRITANRVWRPADVIKAYAGSRLGRDGESRAAWSHRLRTRGVGPVRPRSRPRSRSRPLTLPRLWRRPSALASSLPRR